jgi:hypothetical protein
MAAFEFHMSERMAIVSGRVGVLGEGTIGAGETGDGFMDDI